MTYFRGSRLLDRAIDTQIQAANGENTTPNTTRSKAVAATIMGPNPRTPPISVVLSSTIIAPHPSPRRAPSAQAQNERDDAARDQHRADIPDEQQQRHGHAHCGREAHWR